MARRRTIAARAIRGARHRPSASAAPQVKVAVTDIDGVLRGKYLHTDKFRCRQPLEGGFGFCDVVFGWDMTDRATTTPR